MQLRKFALAALIGLTAATTQIACDNVKPPPSGQSDLLSPDAYPPVVADGGLKQALFFSRPIIDLPTDTRPMQIEWPVRNVTDHVLYVQYHYDFLDAVGHVLNDSDGWQSAELTPRLDIRLKAGALDVRAERARLTVRPKL